MSDAPPISRPDHAIVLQGEDLDPHAAAWLMERCELRVCHFADEPRFTEELQHAHALVVRTYTRVGKDLLDRAPRLRVVARAGVGLDRIDVCECRRRGIEVVHTPDANGSAVAEYVFALLFDAMRPRVFLDRWIDAKRWDDLRRELNAPRQLREITFGLWGLGRIGQRVARIAAGFGADVLYHDLREIPEPQRHGAKPVLRDELLARADVLSIHVDPRPANRHLLNADVTSRLKPTVIVVNTSRGPMVDAAALAIFLRTNERATALLDVHDPEPFGPDYPLLGLANAHLSPHIAAATRLAHENMSWVVRDVWRVLRGETPEFPAP